MRGEGTTLPRYGEKRMGRARDHPCDTSVARRAPNTSDTWVRCVMERHINVKRNEMERKRLTTGIAHRFALGISTPKRRSGGLTVSTGLDRRRRSRLGQGGVRGDLFRLSILYKELSWERSLRKEM